MLNRLITKHLSVSIISVNGAEDLALLPDGLVFVSSVSVITFRLVHYDESVNIPSGQTPRALDILN